MEGRYLERSLACDGSWTNIRWTFGIHGTRAQEPAKFLGPFGGQPNGRHPGWRSKEGKGKGARYEAVKAYWLQTDR